MCNDFVLMCIKAINNSYFIDTKKTWGNFIVSLTD